MTARGQTTLDFAVGASIFLTVVIFTVAFIPSMFGPFDSDTGADTTTADRVADRLANDVLVADALSPGELDESCTAEFFDADAVAPADCRYSVDADDLGSVAGVSDRTRLNVTVRNRSGVRSLGGTRLTAGPSPTSVSDAVVAKRAVLLGGEQNRLYVRVW